MDEKEKMPSSAFKSAGRKEYKYNSKADQPGPNAYDVKLDYVIASSPGTGARTNPMPRTGRDVYIGASDVDRLVQRATSTIVGPGSYNSHSERSIGKESKTRVERSSRVASSDAPNGIGFQARQPARDLPFVKRGQHAFPGPASYSIESKDDSKKTFNAKVKAGTSSFGTTAPRGENPRDARDMVPGATGDPGAYSPETNHLANQSRSSFSKSSKSGSGGFGAKQPRTLQLDSVVNTDDPTPAPGTYSPEKALASSKMDMSHMDEKEKMPSSAFKSAGRKEYKYNSKADQPGPNAYDVKLDYVIASSPGTGARTNPMPRTGRDVYIGASDVDRLVQRATSTIVGPGSYNSHSERSIGKESKTRVERSSRVASSDAPNGIGFQARQPARDLPFVKRGQHAFPGPASYSIESKDDSKKTFNAKVKAGTSSFGTTAPRGENPRDARDMVPGATGDPGAYSPETNHLANQSRSSFSKSSKSGSGGFGAKQPRTLQLDSVVNTDDPTPAPGTYSPEKALASSKMDMSHMDEKEKMPSSAFKSAGRKEYKYNSKADQPGPNAYDVKLDYVIASSPGTGARTNPMPRTGRDVYIGASDVDRLVQRATSTIVGPGSYQTANTHTIRARMLRRVARGLSSQFVSDSVRDMFSSHQRNDQTMAIARV